MTKYYCPRKWYKNEAGMRPCFDDIKVAVVFHDDYVAQVLASTGAYRWNLLGGGGDIIYFRVAKRTPKLVENPSVHVSEVLKPRR